MNKLDPTRSMYLRGFDRRGCTASLNGCTSSLVSVSGTFSDIADFAVLVLYDADDLYGHLTTSKYLPDFDLFGVILEFDLITFNCISPISSKFPSVPWDSLSYIKADGTSGTISLAPYITSGDSISAKCLYTIVGTPTTFDRIQLVYLGNVVFDLYTITTGETVTDVAEALIALINTTDYTTLGVNPLLAVLGSAPGTFIVSADVTLAGNPVGRDGNAYSLLTMNKAGNGCTLTPDGNNKLAGGQDPFKLHVTINFTALGIDQLRQAWFTIAPALPYSSAAGVPTLSAFNTIDFQWQGSNWKITDPNNKIPLKIAGLGSKTVNCQNKIATFGGTWVIEGGFYNEGFAKVSSTVGDTVTVSYFCQAIHDLYIGTSLYVDRGSFSIVLNGNAEADVVTNLNASEQLNTRRLIKKSIPAGDNIIVLTVKAFSGHSICYYDYLHAVIPSDPLPPLELYPNYSAALDWDTYPYKLDPTRVIWISNQLGFRGDIDLYAGVFFPFIRRRRNGLFNTLICTITGTPNAGDGFGAGADTFYFTLDTTTFGVTVFPADSIITIATRFVNGINTLFVGVRAFLSATPGVFEVTQMSPINGFGATPVSPITGYFYSAAGNTATAFYTGNVLVGNEGIWEIDPTKTLPLNNGFADWLSAFSATCKANGLTFTLAFSQELLAPPDVNTADGAWIQRYPDGSTVLTDTVFGSWGTGYIAALTLPNVTEYGHGYISGYSVNIATVDSHGTITELKGKYPITVNDNDSFTLGTMVIGSGTGANPVVGDQVFADLKTSQCAFNPATVTTYIAKIYVQAASIIATTLVFPKLQFGEILHWFFPNASGMAFYDANQQAAANDTLSRDLVLFTLPTNDPAINGHTDANFLMQRLKNHIHTIRTAVIAVIPYAKFEWLLPNDVCYKSQFINTAYPFNIGGRLNKYINEPTAYMVPGSDIDTIIMESLAFGTSYRDVDKAKESMLLPLTSPFDWPVDKISYLIPLQNAGCPYLLELDLAIRNEIPHIKFWAIDHIILFSWQIPMIARPNLIKSGLQPNV